MQIHYWNNTAKCPNGNFGDMLNLLIWPQVIPEIVKTNDKGLLLGIGTVISDDVGNGHKVAVMGSGVGYGSIPASTKEWRIYCLRGPRTARALDVDPCLAVTDSALLIRDCYKTKRVSTNVDSSVAFIPHWQTPKFPWKDACENVGIDYIDPSEPVEDILYKIINAKYVLAEAMHGAIVADALRVPWIPVSTRPSINNFKWDDWCESMELTYQPINFYWRRYSLNNKVEKDRLTTVTLKLASLSLKNLLRKSKPLMSSDKIIAKRTQTLYECLEQLREDWLQGLFN